MKKKSILSLLVFTLILSFSLAGCGGDNGTADKGEKEYIIGTDTVFAPFEFQDEAGDFVGIDVDLLAAIAEDQGFKYKLESLGFDAAVQALESNQVDGVIAGMSVTPAREEKYDFADPYFASGVIMGIKEGDTSIKSYEDLKGKKVAAKTGTAGLDFAQANEEKYGYTITMFDSSPMMYEEVKSGNAVACFEDEPVLRFGIQNGNGLEIVTEKEMPNNYAFAVIKGENAELREMFNAGLKNIKENGKYDEIMAKYGQEKDESAE